MENVISEYNKKQKDLNKEFLKKLKKVPIKIRRRILKLTKKAHSDYIKNFKRKVEQNVLSHSFVYSLTKEGSNYWFKISIKYNL